jgi:hypothetical protein
MLRAMVKIVTPGLDPGVHLQKKMMDGRAKASGSDAVLRTPMPGHDS